MILRMTLKKPITTAVLAVLVSVSLPEPQPALLAQAAPAAQTGVRVDPSLYSGMRWRSLGPNRGGRSIAAAGSASRPHGTYFGTVGGGVWKTSDFGLTWAAVGDTDFRTTSVGAIAIAPSNPDIVYAGMGESCFRGNIIQGDGVYKTSDGGKSWQHVGLADTEVVSKIRIHPTNPDIVYAAVLGRRHELPHLVGGRHRRRAVESRHRLRRMGESCFRGNIIQGDGVYKTADARQDVDPRRARDHGSHQQDPRASRRIPISSTRPSWAIRTTRTPIARRLPVARTAARPGSACCFATTAPAPSTSRWIRKNPDVLYAAMWQVYRTPWSMESGGPGQRAVQVDRRRHDVDRDHQEHRAAHPDSGAGPACRSRAPTAIASTRSSRTTTAACSCRTTPARRGGGPTRIATCASARSITRTSTPTRWTRTRSTCSTCSSSSPPTAARRSRRRFASAARRQPRPVDRAQRQQADGRRPTTAAATSRSTAGRPGRARTFATGQFYNVFTTRHVPYHVCGAQQDNSTACVGSQNNPGARRRQPAADLLRRRRRRERLHRARSDRHQRVLRRQLRRLPEPARSRHRPAARGEHLSEQPDGLVVGRHQGTVPVDVPDRLLAHRSQGALRLVAASVADDQRRPALAAHQPATSRARIRRRCRRRAGRSPRIRPASRPTR